jgi:hypothetical protein
LTFLTAAEDALKSPPKSGSHRLDVVFAWRTKAANKPMAKHINPLFLILKLFFAGAAAIDSDDLAVGIVL